MKQKLWNYVVFINFLVHSVFHNQVHFYFAKEFSISNIFLFVWDDCGILNSFTISKSPRSYLERSVTANQIAFLIFFLLILQIISHQLQDYLQDKD